VRSGNRVRISAQLIDARTDTHLWAQSYEREFGEVLEVQDTIASDIAGQLKATLTTGAAPRHVSIDPDAYDAYLRGRNEQGKQRGSAMLSAVRDFEKAIDLEPRYAPAFAGLADSYSLLANYGVLMPSVAFARAEAAARKALELDAASAEAHTALAYVLHHYDWDWSGAESEYRRSLQINPQSPTTHLRYAEYLSTMGRHAEAISEIRLAQSAAPLSRVIGSNVGQLLYYARRNEEAIAELQQLLTLDPERAYARIYLAMAYEAEGDCTRALAEMTRANAQFGGGPGPGLAHVYARCGQRDEARHMLTPLEQPPKSGVYDWVWIAAIHAQLGERDQAFLWLERAYEARDFFLPFCRVMPYMDPLRSDPRFDGLLKKMDADGAGERRGKQDATARSTSPP
jgi:tetratricopeptide (TPR) repeat protein